MENNLKFNSAICTSRFQSERLLSLGLKKETADCALLPLTDKVTSVLVKPSTKDIKNTIPAWSLHRLLSILPRYVRKEYEVYGRKYIIALDLIIDEDLCIGYKEGIDEPCDDKVFYAKDIYSSLCDCIEWLIKEGYFNKEYLV